MLREYQHVARSACVDDGNCGARRPYIDHPTIFSEPAAVFGPALRNHWPDAALTQRTPASCGIVAAIGVDDARLLNRSATAATNGGIASTMRQQLRDIVGARAGQDRDDGNAVGVYEDVVLGTGARTDDESTAAYDRSIWPAARNLSSSNACSWSHTPTFCQSFNRRQQVAPEPKPNRVESSRQVVPVDSRFEYEQDAVECRTIGASILELPLFWCSRLTACQGSKQLPRRVFELAPKSNCRYGRRLVRKRFHCTDRPLLLSIEEHYRDRIGQIATITQGKRWATVEGQIRHLHILEQHGAGAIMQSLVVGPYVVDLPIARTIKKAHRRFPVARRHAVLANDISAQMSTIPALEVEIHASMGRHRAQYQGKPASGTSARPHWFPFRPLTPNPSCHWSPFSICSRVPPIALRGQFENSAQFV